MQYLNNGGQQTFRIRAACGQITAINWTLSGSPIGQWHYIVGGYDGAGNLFLSVDAATIQTQAITPSGTGGAGEFSIGSSAIADWDWDGKIARAGVWIGRALSQSDITALFNSGVGKSYSDLTAAEKVSLTSYWNLDEVSGNRSDSHGSNTLTDTNTVTSVVNAGGAVNNVAARFLDENAEYLSVADNSSLTISDATGFTVNIWVKREAGCPISRDNAVDQREWVLYVDGNFYCFKDAQAITASVDITTDSNWHMYTCGWDPADGKAFAIKDNGTVSRSVVTLTGINNSSAPLLIGAWHPAAQLFEGQIDGAGLWGRVLTAQEITDLWNDGAGLFYDD